MSHDATKVLMGMTQSSFRHATPRVGLIEAGKIVRLKSDGTISLLKADGLPLGLSLGKDLSNAGYTSICRYGLGVPVLLTAAFTPVVGAQVNISDTTGMAGTAGAGFTGVNAVYTTAALSAIKEDGTTVAAAVALIDIPGGL